MKKLFKIFIIFSLIGLLFFGYFYYSIFAKTIKNPNNVVEFYLNKGDNLDSLITILNKQFGYTHSKIFKLIAQKRVGNKLKNGRYKFDSQSVSAYEIITKLQEAKTKTVNLTIKGVISLEKFASICGKVLERDSSDFRDEMNNFQLLDSIGFNSKTVYSLIIPNTYNLYYYTQPDELLLKFKTEYDKFWSKERLAKAKEIILTPLQVSILASIVCKETSKVDEMPTIAGLYMNRFNIGMKLQADPTASFATGKHQSRVLDEHTRIESEYNTYYVYGLPPGPICVPSIQSIDAVLNYEKHDYFFMCARLENDGYHHFTRNFEEHKKYAKEWRKVTFN